MKIPAKYRLMRGVLSVLPAVVLTCSLSTPVILMAASVETTTDEQPEVAAATNSVIVVSPASVEVYLNAQIANLMNGQAATPDHHFANLGEASAGITPFLADLAAKRLRLTIYFTGNDALSGLDSGGVNALKQLAAAGAVLAVGSPDGSVLKNLLGMDSSRNLIDEIGSGTNAIYLLYGTEELLLPLDGMSVRSILAGIFDWAAGVDAKALARGDSPWTALATRDQRISYNDNNSARFLVELYKLASTTSTDWYRFDFALTSTISSFSCDDASSRCGWYTTDSDLSAMLFHSQLYDYIPTGTLSDRSESFSIGGSIDTGAVGVNAGYSIGYSTPDMSIRDTTNFATNTAAWDVSFNGPDYKWAPWYIKPANAAQASYTWKPSLIAKVTAGKKGVICLKPNIRYRKDNISLTWYLALQISGTSQYWSSASMCYAFGPNGLTYQGTSIADPN